MLSISFLYLKESFMSNFTTARKKRFFNAATSNRFPCYHVNKRILFLLINKSLVQKYRKCSSNFSISECYFLNLKKLKHSWTPHSPFSFQNFQKKGVSVFKIFKKKGWHSHFSHKNGGVGKTVGNIGGVFLKRGGLSLIFILTNPFQCYLSLSVWCVCFVYLHHF